MDHGRSKSPIPPPLAFFRPAMFLGWNPGTQTTNLGTGGPQGFAQGTAQPRPYPYQTGTRRFIAGGPYGWASTIIQPRAWPYATASRAFKPPMGWIYKAPTGPGISF